MIVTTYSGTRYEQSVDGPWTRMSEIPLIGARTVEDSLAQSMGLVLLYPAESEVGEMMVFTNGVRSTPVMAIDA